jgi:hypothetical protein
MKLPKFNFLRGIISARIVNIEERLTLAQPRYPRIPMGQIPYPENCETPREKRIFGRGWRACERGMEVYDNPYSNREELIYSLHRIWESGYLECFLHHPSRQIQPTDEESYQEGWATAQLGLPLNENPHTYGSHQFNMWYVGWNDFVDNH